MLSTLEVCVLLNNDVRGGKDLEILLDIILYFDTHILIAIFPDSSTSFSIIFKNSKYIRKTNLSA